MYALSCEDQKIILNDLNGKHGNDKKIFERGMSTAIEDTSVVSGDALRPPSLLLCVGNGA